VLNVRSKILKRAGIRKGFSLVELSIVLIIIGLLVSGISAGSALIEQSRLRSVVSDVDEYKAILNTFILTYDDLPGDMPNAHDFWGSSCDSTASKCNGDGNERIDWGGGTDDNESLRAWQHLQLSAILSGSWDGVSSVSNSAVVEDDYPASGLRGAGYTFTYWSGTQINVINVGGTLVANASVTAHNPVFLPKQLYSIDKKYDDASARTGNTIAGRLPSSPNVCWTDSSLVFNLSSGSLECYVHFVFKKE